MVVQEKIDKAVAVLRRGGLVAFPTETVYGLGADASNPEALEKIFVAKQRPADHPLIVHIAEASAMAIWAREVSATAEKLAAAFWPGPLTLILKKAPGVLDKITGGQDTVGIRVPEHPVAQALLTAFGQGVAAPSANRFGRISPTTALAVDEELEDTVDYILEGGQCAVGVESTIVDVSGEHPVILRPGMITAQQIAAVLQEPVHTATAKAPRVSGSMESHYAPETPTELMSSQQIPSFVEEITLMDLPLAILSYSHPPMKCVGIEWIAMPKEAKQYAHDLYHALREIDKMKLKRLVVEQCRQAMSGMRYATDYNVRVVNKSELDASANR